MVDDKGTQLHDDLVDTRGERLLGWFIGLPGLLQVVLGCGGAIVAFILGMIVWGVIVAIIF